MAQRSLALVWASVALFVATFAWFILPPHSLSTIHQFSKTIMPGSKASTDHWDSPLSGFLQRADPYPGSNREFRPARSSLKLAVLRNAPVEPEGFTLAVFSSGASDDDLTQPYYAVDARGIVRVLKQADVDILKQLLVGVRRLPLSDNFRNTWRLKQETTSQPIDRILIPRVVLGERPADDYENEYDEVGVQGFDYRVRELKEAVEDIQTLPQELWELTGAVLEARHGDQEDGGVLSYVRRLLGNVF